MQIEYLYKNSKKEKNGYIYASETIFVLGSLENDVRVCVYVSVRGSAASKVEQSS